MRNSNITSIYVAIDPDYRVIYADSNIMAFHKGLNKIIKTPNYYALTKRFRTKDRFQVIHDNKVYWLQRV